MARTWITILVAVATLSCTSLVSDQARVKTSGIPYFLPKTQMRLEVKVEKEKATASRAAANSNQGNQGKDGGRTSSSANPSAVATATASVVTAAENKAKTAGGEAAPSVVIRIARHDISLKAHAERWPDPTKLHYLRQTSNWLSNDAFDIKVNEKGLLTGINATADDHTAQILVTIGATILAGLQVAGAQVPTIYGLQQVPPVAPPTARQFDEDTLRELLTALQGTHQSLGPSGSGACFAPETGSSDTGREGIRLEYTLGRQALTSYTEPDRGWFGRQQHGVIVPVAEPFELETKVVAYKPGYQDLVLGTLDSLVLMPDCSPEFVIPVKGTAFAKVQHSLKLTDGVLSEIKVDSPSPILSIVSIPAQIAERAVQIVGNLISLRFGAPKQAAQESKDLLEAQKALLQLQKEISALQEAEDAAATP